MDHLRVWASLGSCVQAPATYPLALTSQNVALFFPLPLRFFPSPATFGLSGCPRKDTQRERKKNKNGAGGGKKHEILGPPPFGPPTWRCATLRGHPSINLSWRNGRLDEKPIKKLDESVVWMKRFWVKVYSTLPPFGPTLRLVRALTNQDSIFDGYVLG